MKKNAQKQIRIRHAIPGRIRLKIEYIRFSESRANSLVHWLSEQKPVVRVEARPMIGSVIVIYNPDQTRHETILELVRRAMEKGPIISPPQISPIVPICGLDFRVCHPITKPAQKRSLLGRLVEVVTLTAFMIFSLMRTVIFKSPLAQGPFTIVAGVVVVGAIPLFLQALEDLRQGKAMSLFSFLASTCILAIFLGEALTALEVIWILRVGMLLEDYVAERSRRAISEILQVATKDTYLLIDGVEVKTAVDDLQKGDTFSGLYGNVGHGLPLRHCACRFNCRYRGLGQCGAQPRPCQGRALYAGIPTMSMLNFRP